MHKVLPRPSESESEKDQRTIGKDQRMSSKTSKNIFAFTFARCGQVLQRMSQDKHEQSFSTYCNFKENHFGFIFSDIYMFRQK